MLHNVHGGRESSINTNESLFPFSVSNWGEYGCFIEISSTKMLDLSLTDKIRRISFADHQLVVFTFNWGLSGDILM